MPHPPDAVDTAQKFPRLHPAALTDGARCANCDAVLTAGQHFCGNCSQKVPSHRISVHDIVHDVIHAIFHVDRSIVSLVRALVVRPGRVAHEYISGYRKRYFGPFTFVAIVVAIASLAMSASGFMNVDTSDVRLHDTTSFLQRHVNLVILFQVPLLAAWSKQLFPGSKLYFAEHMVLAAYTSGMRSIFFTLVALPAWYVLHESHANTGVIIGYILAWAAYYGFAASQFHEGHRGWSWFKGAIAALLTQLTTTIIISLMTMAYFGYLKYLAK